MSCRKVQALGPLVAAAVVVASGMAEAAYWKDYTGDHLLGNTLNWYGTTEWTPEQAAAWWPTTCMTFEEATEPNGGWSNQPWEAALNGDMSVQNIETGHNGITGSFDLNGHSLSTTHSDWGLFIKGERNLLEFGDGNLCVTGKVSIGDSNGSSDTLRILPGGVLHSRALGIGGGGLSDPSSTNNVLDVAGGKVLFDIEDRGWGHAIGENPGDGGGMMLVRDGGIVSNFFNSALVGYKSCNNSIVVRDGGYYYNQVFLQLGQLNWDWNWPCTNNMIKAESGGVVEMHSGLYIGSGSSPSSTSRNVVWAGDGGRIICGGDVGVEGNENIFVVSNGFLCCNSLHSINEHDGQGYYGTRFVFAGSSPEMQVYYYFSLRKQASVEFVVPEGGYLTTPLTVRNGCKVDEDTSLSVDVRGVLSTLSGGTRANFRLINADSDGYGVQKIYVPDDDESFTKLTALVDRWNALLPAGARVYLSRERCELWLEVCNPGMRVTIR